MNKEKHIRLADILREEIKEGFLAPGEKFPSQNELCKKYSMSRTSVHYAFNELEKHGLVVRRPGKGIYVKENGKPRELKDVAVLLPETQYLRMRNYDNFGLEIFWGIEKSLREKGLSCKLRVISHDERDRLADIVLDMSPDGVILARTFKDEEIKDLAKLNIPVVLAGRISDSLETGGTIPNVSDYYIQFCRKLISEGKRDIAIFSRKDLFTRNEFEFVAKTLDRLTEDVSVKVIYYAPDDLMSGDDEAFVYDSVKNMAEEKSLPDVFIGATDWVAYRIIEKLIDLGVNIPSDVKVIGCLGISMPQGEFPQITTFKVDTFELGKRTVEALCRMHENNNEPVMEKISMEYIERESYQRKQGG